MADAIVSIVLEQLASIAHQQIQEEVTLICGVSKEVERLTSNLQAIQAVLVDAEQRQVKDASVKLWLDKLKEVSYDVETALDEWNTSKLKLQIERTENALTLKKKVRSFFLSPCFCFKQVVLRHNIALKIKEVNESLDGIAKEKDRYSFSTIASGEQPRGIETISFIDEYSTFGREKENKELVSKLLSQSSNEEECLHIISIVGMGGIGKTTLAQLVYNNNEVKNHFDRRIWVCVSNPFDKLWVANAILQGLEGQSSSSTTLQTVLGNIHQSIVGKKLLLVLDDVWTEDYKDWEPLYNCLKNCHNGSKIVVTTRKEKVALMMKSIVIPIRELSENESWSLFKHFAFYDKSDKECRELVDIGKGIVSKCKGLPLAAKTMGSFLRFKRTRNEWKIILDSEMWVVEEFEKEIFGPLSLSYNDLPPMVKRCFSYCAIFPKDYHLNKDELIKLWMGQGYLELERNKEMEMIGEDYFNILAMRSFFQEFIKNDIGDIKGCKMHDIVHDFAQFLTRNECLALIDKDFGQSSINISFEKAHHLMLMVDENSSFPISICNFKKLRSLLFKFDGGMHSIDGVLLNLLSQNTCLRALALSGVRELDMMTGVEYSNMMRFEKIPREIGKLMNLRYLDLSNNLGLEVLPKTLCQLYNLQTLILFNCENLRELPHGIGKLVNLRHLINDRVNSLKYMPKGLENLTCLRTLRRFHVGESRYGHKVSSVGCLNKFHHLQGTFRIVGLGNMTNESEAHRIDLKSKINISLLELNFGGSNSIYDEAILEALQPPPNLPGLIISAYAGNVVLPTWMMLLTNLRRLTLSAWIKCEQLPLLGKLSSLESLSIERMERVKRVGNEVLGLESDNITSSLSSSVTAFPNLKSLTFCNMEEWEEWDIGIEHHNIKVMPPLRFLEIDRCPKLTVLPKQILQMATLQKLVIDDCSVLSESYKKGTGEKWSDISHIPNIQIDREDLQRDRP